MLIYYQSKIKGSSETASVGTETVMTMPEASVSVEIARLLSGKLSAVRVSFQFQNPTADHKTEDKTMTMIYDRTKEMTSEGRPGPSDLTVDIEI